MNFDEGLKMVRNDPQVNFDWGSSSPDWGCGDGINCRLKCDGFSVRWTGYVNIPTSGTWTFGVTVDDGVRLWVDGQPIINDWADTPGTYNVPSHRGSITLAAGWYPILLEFYEHGGGATIRLYYRSPVGTWKLVPSSGLRTCSHPPTIDLTCQFTSVSAATGPITLLGHGTAGNPYRIQRGTAEAITVNVTGIPDPGEGTMNFSVVPPSGEESTIQSNVPYSGGGLVEVSGTNCSSHYYPSLTCPCATCNGSYHENRWVNYSVTFPSAGTYYMQVRLRHDAGCESDQLFYRFRFDGAALPSYYATKGDNSWEWIAIDLGSRAAGSHTFGFALGHDCYAGTPESDLNAYVETFQFVGGGGTGTWALVWTEPDPAALPEGNGYLVKAHFNGTGVYAPTETYCYFNVVPPANAEFIISAREGITGGTRSFCWGQDAGCLLSYYPGGSAGSGVAIDLPDYSELISRFGSGATVWGADGSFPNSTGVYHRNGNITRNAAFNFSSGQRIVIFVSGTLTINGNITVPNDSAVVFIVRDGISFSQDLVGPGSNDLADGVYIAAGSSANIDTGYNYVSGATPRLLIQGALISTKGRVILRRSLSDIDSAMYAAEQISLPAKYLVLMRTYLGEAQINWREVTP